jgi:hypothetical protein
MAELGNALEVNPKSIAVYSESIIRSNIIFHLSNLLERIYYYISTRLKLPPYLIIASGSVNGIVRFEKSCTTLKMSQVPLIVFVDEVQGDEEFLECVKGMIIQREIPLLSHLAIRIRQSSAVCCACKNVAFYNKLKLLVRENDQCQLSVTSEGVALRQAKINSMEYLNKRVDGSYTIVEPTAVNTSIRFLITSPKEAQTMFECIGTKVMLKVDVVL